MRAACFDVGDTLVEHWAPDVGTRARAALVAAFGERDWYDAWIEARLEPTDASVVEQRTLDWYRAWFERERIALDDIDLDAIRRAMTLPLPDISTPVPGAFEALRWCHARGLAVVLVTNTLSRGDAEVLADWERFGLRDVIAGVASSHSVGWRKPHPAIFRRALEIAGCAPDEAFMVGDDLAADIAGAKGIGLRAIWRRTPARSGKGYAGPAPDATVDDLTQLPDIVGPWLRG